jgi:hypothetical protein
MTKKFHGCGATRSTGNTITWKELGEKRDDNAFVREVMHDSELDVETWEPGNQHLRTCFDSIITRQNRKGHGGQFNEFVVVKLWNGILINRKWVILNQDYHNVSSQFSMKGIISGSYRC